MAALLIAACQSGEGSGELDNDVFRTRVVAFVRAVAMGSSDLPCTLPASVPPSAVRVSMYHQGLLVGLGSSAKDELCPALESATQQALTTSGFDRSRLAQIRFTVALTDLDYELVEYQGEGVELINDLVPVRTLDKRMLRQHIDEGTAYLLRVMDPELGGVHKYYHAPTDTFEERLHTIYTASTIYTLLAVHALDQDERLREPIERAAGFLLAMQRAAPGEPTDGAFHYSLHLAHSQPEPRFVVGTTAKSIFTLIELHTFSEDQLYLDAARRAADWLLTMQDLDGRVWSELSLNSKGVWTVNKRESILYTGQVLSALARLYEVTAAEQYLDAASLTAKHLRAKIGGEGCFLGDHYRPPNPISSSWAILSLFDFARASGDATARKIALGCADQLLAGQIDDPDDPYRHGRWRGSLSSSGNGWLAEVLAELYRDCPNDDSEGCARYRDAVIRLFRLLLQYTYSPENSFVAQNPDMARGGLFWNTLDRQVRTDSVCHAMNAYVFMINHLPDGVLIELPEPPLAERLGIEDLSAAW